MELTEFINSVLVSIINGVDAARIELKEQGDAICFPFNKSTSTKTDVSYDHIVGRYFQQIEFDVAVTAETTGNNGGKAGVKVLGLEANIGANSTVKNSAVNRIKFSVPLGLRSSKPSSQ